MYNPYDPFLANSLAQVQAAGGLGSPAGMPPAAGATDPRLHNLAAQVAAGSLAAGGGVRPPHNGFPGAANAANLAAAAAAGLPAGLSLQAAMTNPAAYSAGAGLQT